MRVAQHTAMLKLCEPARLESGTQDKGRLPGERAETGGPHTPRTHTSHTNTCRALGTQQGGTYTR
jgi:hypothetical protein